MREIILCSDCAKSLENAYQYLLWKKACSRSLDQLEANDFLLEALSFLERKGFIYTHETNEQIFVKSCKGIPYIGDFGDATFYCANQHAEDCND
jgi:hypothetical protein